MISGLNESMKEVAQELTQRLLPNVKKEQEEKDKLETLMKEHYETEETRQLRALSKDIGEQFRSKENRMILHTFTGQSEIEGQFPDDTE